MQTNKKATLSIPQSLIYCTLEIFIFHVHENLCWAHTIHTMSSPQKKRCLWVKIKKKADILLFFYLLYFPWVTIRSRHSTADRAIMQSVWNSTNKYMHKCKCEKSLKKCQKCQSGIWYSFQKVQLMGSRYTERKTYNHTNRYFSIHTHVRKMCSHENKKVACKTNNHWKP